VRGAIDTAVIRANGGGGDREDCGDGRRATWWGSLWRRTDADLVPRNAVPIRVVAW